MSQVVSGFWRRVLLADDAPPTAQTRAEYSIGDPALAEFLNVGGEVLAGVEVTEKSTLGLTAVYRAVSIISGTIAGLPLRSLRTASDGTRTRVKTFLDNPGAGAYTQFEWLELVMVHLLLHGNAYLQHIFSGAGAVIGLEPIVPSAVSVVRITTAEEAANYGGPDGTFRKYFRVALADGTDRVLTQAEMTHIPALGTDGLVGVSPIAWHRQALGTGIAGDRAAARLFGSGFLLAGIVSGDDDMDKDEAAAAQEALRAKLAGTSHAGEFAFVNARLKFTPWSIPPADAQFIESRSHQIIEISRIFGIPPHLLGETQRQTSWGTGVEEQNRGLARYTLASWTTRIEQKLSGLLSDSTICEFDYSGLLQPSPEVEIPLLLQQVAAGVITLEEFRRIRNMAPLPAGVSASPPAGEGGTVEEVPA